MCGGLSPAVRVVTGTVCNACGLHNLEDSGASPGPWQPPAFQTGGWGAGVGGRRGAITVTCCSSGCMSTVPSITFYTFPPPGLPACRPCLCGAAVRGPGSQGRASMGVRGHHGQAASRPLGALPSGAGAPQGKGRAIQVVCYPDWTPCRRKTGSWGKQAPCQFLGQERGPGVVQTAWSWLPAWLWLKRLALPGFLWPQMSCVPLPLLASSRRVASLDCPS